MSVVSKVYAPSAVYAVLDTAPPSILKLPVDWTAIKVAALSQREYLPLQTFSVSLEPQEAGRMATRHLANCCVNQFFGAGNIRVELSSALS